MGPLPGNWLAACIADLLSSGSTVLSFYSRHNFSVSFFYAGLGLPAPCLPSICISYAIMTAPHAQTSEAFVSVKMRLRSSFASSSLDLTLATSSGLILQICLIMAQHCTAMLQVCLGQWSSFTSMEQGAQHARKIAARKYT